MRAFARITAIAAMTVGAAVTMGWLFDIPLLKSFHPGWAAMKANTAAGFLLAGVSLYTAAHEHGVRFERITGRLSAAAVLTLSLLTLSQDITRYDIGIDQLLFADTAGAAAPGRMSPATAACFVFTASALLLRGTRRRNAVSLSFSILAVFASFIALAGYVFGAPSLYHVPGYGSVALHTALMFFVFNIALALINPSRPLQEVVSSDLAGSFMLRRVFLIAVPLILLMGWLRIAGQDRGLYDTHFGTSFFIMTNIVIISLVLYFMARSQNRTETSRLRAIEDAQSSERSSRRIIETAQEGIMITGPEGTTLYANKMMSDILGCLPAELRGKRVFEFMDDETRALALGKLDEHRIGLPGHYRMKLKRKDGTVIWTGFSSTPLFDDNKNFLGTLAMVMDITAEKKREEELDNYRAHLEEIVAVRTGELIQANAQLQQKIDDIQKARDEIEGLNRDLSRNLEETDMMNKELDAFTYSVSHDLRAPLRAIAGFSAVIMDDYAESLNAEVKDILTTIKNRIDRMGRLIDDLLAFSKLGRQEIRTTRVDMTLLAKSVFSELKSMERGRNVKFELFPLPPAEADLALMREVFLNLFTNALKFTGTRDTATITVGAMERENNTVYYVQDNGVGYDMRFSHKLFGMFQRLHAMEEFSGTGVGLAIVQRIVAHHGGLVCAEGRPGEGAKFYFSLPRKKGEEPQAIDILNRSA